MPHALQVLLLLTLAVSAAKLAGALAIRIGQPSAFGEMLAGLILGPTVLGILGRPLFATGVAEVPLLSTVRDLVEIGVILLIFVAGLETDLVAMRRVGKVAFWSAFAGVLLPMVGGAVDRHRGGRRPHLGYFVLAIVAGRLLTPLLRWAAWRPASTRVSPCR